MESDLQGILGCVDLCEETTVIVIDNFAPWPIVRSLQATWLPAASGHWHCYDNGKRATKDPDRLPQAARVLLQQMAGIDTAALLGVTAFPDLEYLHGAGLHEMPAGSTLGLHLDAEHHPALPWRREASAVLYLDDLDGGELQLCDDRQRVIEAIDPRANRLVLFATPGQWHRVAECRAVRRSLCLFFWSLAEGNKPSGDQCRAFFAPDPQ